MKFSAFPALLAIILSAVLSYLTFYLNVTDENCWVITIGTFIGLVSTLIPIMSLSTPNGRAATNIKAINSIMLIAMIISTCIFTFAGVNAPFYVIITSILVVFSLYYTWKILKADID